MKTGVKGYFLKEYGSWSVLSVSFLIGLIVSREASWLAVPLFLALGLLINSKQAFMKWVRRKEDSQSLFIFLGQVLVAACMMAAIFRGDVPRLLPLLCFPAAYLISNKLAGEHHLVTEILGFTLISLAAVLSKFLVTGGIDVRLFVAVVFYFSAGVFKVKTLVLKKTGDRILTILWVVIAVFAFNGFHISRLILLPLFDNVLAALTLYKAKLKTIGWMEVAKSLAFLILMAALY